MVNRRKRREGMERRGRRKESRMLGRGRGRREWREGREGRKGGREGKTFTLLFIICL